MEAENTMIINDLTVIFRDVLDSEQIILNEASSANDIAEWDSVSHLILIHAIEEHYHIKFELGELINFRTVGDICISIRNKIS